MAYKKGETYLVSYCLNNDMEISFSGATKPNKPNDDGTFLWGCHGSAHPRTRLSFQASCFEIYKCEILIIHFLIHMLEHFVSL